MSSLFSRLSNYPTVTFSTQIPFLKTRLFLALARKYCSEGTVHYIDLDLQFSSLLCLRSESEYYRNELSNLDLRIVTDSDALEAFTRFVSRNDLGHGGAIFIDSVNTLQEVLLQSKDEDYSRANHRAGVLLTLFQDFARRYSKSLILSNLARSRPSLKGLEVPWEKESPGGRMIRSKSNILLFVSQDPESKIIRFEVESIRNGSKGDLNKGQKIEISPQKAS